MVMFTLWAVDNAAFQRRIEAPSLAPTYDIHVEFNPKLLGGIFEKASLEGQLIEMTPFEALPVSGLGELLSP